MPAESLAVETALVHGAADRVDVRFAASIALDAPGGEVASAEQRGAEDAARVLGAGWLDVVLIVAGVVHHHSEDVVGVTKGGAVKDELGGCGRQAGTAQGTADVSAVQPSGPASRDAVLHGHVGAGGIASVEAAAVDLGPGVVAVVARVQDGQGQRCNGVDGRALVADRPARVVVVLLDLRERVLRLPGSQRGQGDLGVFCAWG